jgi:HD-like signal output (HDOD) protein
MNLPGENLQSPRSRVLFVDDEHLLLEGLKRSLHCMRAHWDMTFVQSGPAALFALGQDPYDIIVTDMRMPGMDGAQLLEVVKEKYPDVLRMVLSGQASRQDVLRSVGPAHQYISKPCDPQELKSRLSQALMTRGLLKNPNSRALVLGLQSIPSPPMRYDEIQSELQSENVSPKKIAGIVSRDPGMTAKILQLANSAFIGAHLNVSNAAEATTLIGTDMLRALVLSAHVFSQCRDESAADCAILCDHALAVSSLAQRIALSEKCAQTIVDEASTIGILHDLGRLVLLTEAQGQYTALLAQVNNAAADLNTAERDQFGCTHAELGAYLLSIWGLPNSLIQAVAFHDHPAKSLENSFCALTIVHVADALTSSSAGSAILQDVRLDYEYLDSLGLSARVPLWRSLHQQQLLREKPTSMRT